MTLQIKLRHLTVGIIVVALLAGGGYAFATTRDRVIRVCVNGRTRALTMPANARCGKGSTALAWNQQGPKGAAGAKGARGAAGSAGTPATVGVGAVTTGAPGSQANVTNVGNASNAKLDFTIPQGEPGTDGTNGTNTGPTAYAQVWMGSSEVMLAPNSSHNVTGVGGENGSAVVDVEGCSVDGLIEPVINVTADDDDADQLDGHDSSTTSTPVAWVSHWSTEPETSILAIAVQTVNPATDAAVNSDFSIAVTC